MDRIEIESTECKGCRLCVEACPHHCISVGAAMNSLGYQYARFEGSECNACGLCYYVCPEPGAITVYRERNTREAAV